jgi:hypothetical protein
MGEIWKVKRHPAHCFAQVKFPQMPLKQMKANVRQRGGELNQARREHLPLRMLSTGL